MLCKSTVYFLSCTEKIFLSVLSPFWQKDGYPPQMWTDTTLERIFPLKNSSGEIETLLGWIDGENAMKIDAMPLQELARFIKSELARIRPVTEGNVLTRAQSRFFSQ